MKARIAAVSLLLLSAYACADSDDNDPASPGHDDAGTQQADASVAADAGEEVDAGETDVDAGSDAAVIEPEPEPVACAVQPCAVEIVAKAGTHACARRSDGTVACWGNGTNGQLGADPATPTLDGGAPFGSKPVVVADLPPAAQVAVGGYGYTNNGTGPGTIGLNGNTCARTEGGDVYCWGASSPAFSGVTRPSSFTPARMPFPPAKFVELGNNIVCVLDASGVPVCSGQGDGRDITIPSSANTQGPRRIDTGGGSCRAIVGSARNAFCVEASGAVQSWGFGRSLYPGELQGDVEPSLVGRLSSLEQAPPTSIPTLAGVTHLSASWSTACALSQGTVWCWGRSDLGQLGTGGRTYQITPQPIGVMRGEYARDVATGYATTCAVTNLGRLYCWGDNSRGQLARDDVQSSLTAVRIENVPAVVRVAVLEASVCALTKTGEVLCWGANDRGQLGRGSVDTDAHADPAPVVW